VVRALQAVYGRPAGGEVRDPLSELIFTILSQHTSDGNRDRAWASLWQAFDSWEAIASAPRRRVERAIRVGGLAVTKSRVIQQVLRDVERTEGRYSLDRLRGMSMEDVEELLGAFRGVGIKTIRCVQLFSLGQPAIPVDTHVLRVSQRLGLVPSRASAESAHRIMQSLVPPAERLPFHMNLIAHGRKVCKARQPRCGVCVLRKMCLYVRESETPLKA